MQKVLLLSYYYFPCNATGSNRPNSFAANLVRHGFEVTVVTRHWTGQEKKWEHYLQSDLRPPSIRTEGEVEIHSVPVKRFNYLPKGFSFFDTLWQNLNGNFNHELPFGQLHDYIESLLAKKRFDYILVSTPPLTVLKTGAILAQKFKIPLIVDVRDFENDILLYKEKQHTLFRQFQHLLLMRYFKKWIRSTDIVFTASPPLTHYVQEAGYKNTFTLNNGFTENLLSINEKQHSDCFTITVTGTLYQMANLSIMLNMIKLIDDRHPDAAIKFQFLGLLANPTVANMFHQIIPERKLLITERIPQEEALRKASASHVLMLAGFDDMRGAYTTKIFEYLGLRRNILQVPGDRDVVEELLHHTNAGKAPHTAEEGYEIVMKWYDEWSKTGSLSYNGHLDRMMEYSREKQFEKLLNRLA